MLKAESESAGMHSEYVTSLAYIGQAHMIQGRPDSMSIYFDSVQNMYQGYADDIPMAIMCNALAIHMLYSELNTVKSIDYLLEGLRYARRSNDDTLSAMLTNNLAIAHYFQKDSTGFQYAAETYKNGCRSNNPYMKYSGALMSSYFLYLKQEYDLAWQHIESALSYASDYKDMHGVYTLAGDILLQKGDTSSAMEYYDLALKYNDETDRFSGLDIYLSLASYLKSRGRYEEALSTIDKGLQISLKNNNAFNRYLLYENAAEVCMSMKDTSGYEKFMKLYKDEYNRIFNIENEREIYRLKISYEKGILNNYYAKLKSRTGIWIAMASTISIIAISVMLIFIIKYRKREKELVKALEELRPKFKNITAESCLRTPTMTEDNGTVHINENMNAKTEELFAALDEMMRKDRIYHDSNITRARIAELLSTNRTYVTNIIKEYTGLSFYAYVNTFRIEEAIKILSDTADGTPIKAISQNLGFKSISTFYKLFSAATGHSPASFRDEFLR